MGFPGIGAVRLERAKGIEPSYAAWEAAVLPLNYTRARRPIASEPNRSQPLVETGLGLSFRPSDVRRSNRPREGFVVLWPAAPNSGNRLFTGQQAFWLSPAI